MQVRKQQFEAYMEPYPEPYMEQLTGSKSGKEYDKAIYCHHKESDMTGQLANNNHNIVALQYYVSFYRTVK